MDSLRLSDCMTTGVELLFVDQDFRTLNMTENVQNLPSERVFDLLMILYFAKY